MADSRDHHSGADGEGKDRRAYRLSGVVQGVGFRWWARETAVGLGLRGTVRNHPDGTVRLDVAGEPDMLDRFETLLAQGPPGARVTAIQQDRTGDAPLPRGFDITR